MILLYIFVFAIVSGCILIFSDRRQKGESIVRYGLKSIVFFFALYYFLLSAVKLCLGSIQNTLMESFWDAEISTYIHYGIPLIVVCVVAPVLFLLLFAKRARCIVAVFDFLWVLVMPAAFILSGKISNLAYCLLFVLCMLGSVAYSFIFYGEIEYIEKQKLKKYLWDAFPCICAWVVMTGIFLPNELFLSNSEEFSAGFLPFFLICLLGSVLMGVLIALTGAAFLPKSLFRIWYLAIAGISCAGYVQNLFLNGALAAMNGEQQTWPILVQIVNVGIWLLIIGAVIAGAYHNKTIRNICKGLCIYIVLIQVATLGWLIITADFGENNKSAALTTQGSLEIGWENNVLVFVLDNFDSSWFEALCDEDPTIVEPLSDFTFYRNGTSQFAHTDTAIPYMLTGTKWDAQQGNYLSYAYQNSDALNRIAQKGVKIGIYTDLPLLSESVYKDLENYSGSVTRKYHFAQTYATMLKTSMYKVMPFVIKPSYEYYSDEINDMAGAKNIGIIHNDLLFYNRLLEDGLMIQEGTDSVFRFYHMRGPHAPFYLSDDMKYDATGREVTLESQARGSLKIVYEYLEQLKTLGKYDDATIIITADHGQGNILDSEQNSGQPDKTSRPIFLVKSLKEHHEQMEISDAPVSQKQLLPTILQAFGAEYDGYGKTFEEIQDNERYERTYIDIYGGHTIQFMIHGHAAELENWSVKEAVYQ